MKKFTLFVLLIFVSSLTGFGQKMSKPTKVGMAYEFTGKIVSNYMYDGDVSFTIKDIKHGEIEFFISAGSCHMDGDPYRIDLETPEDMDFYGEDLKGVRVKIIAKSTYGLFCPNCDDCKKQKNIIWRPAKVTRL
jgi:hypothetical protein